MVPAKTRTVAALLTLVSIVALTACSHAPSPSHIDGNYRGRLDDDTMVEASTTVIVTTKPAVIALHCATIAAAIVAGDDAAVERAVATGDAALVPSGVTLYSPPFSAQNPAEAPVVVTDDKHVGTLCTPHSYDVLKS
ncbi:MAG TPA: hypothetical protein VN936_05970 [Candidatus Acidoferrum sp.]|nr:hypothetical protein [Candidatus Acidoferrum sp.]